MPTSVNLQPNFFDAGPFVFFLGLCVVLPLLYKWYKHLKLKRQMKKQMAAAMAANQPVIKSVPKNIKDRYIDQLHSILAAVEKGEISSRVGYQRTSLVVREFVKEYAGVDVTTKTLEEIKSMKILKLTPLVAAYYKPEFAQNEEGNLKEAIEKTIKAIEKWK